MLATAVGFIIALLVKDVLPLYPMTILLRKRKLFGVKLVKLAPQNHLLTAMAKIAAQSKLR
jgi:hypothetical protein